MHSSEYARKVGPFLNTDYFEDTHEKIIFEEILNHIKEYNALPNTSSIKVQIESRDDLTESSYKGAMDVLDNPVPEHENINWLVDTTEQWCKERAVVNAVYRAVAVIGGDDKKTTMSALPDLLHEAIATSFDKSVGHDYMDDADKRWEYYNMKEHKLPTGFEHFDHILRGGIPNKTLGIAMAGTGVGKSLFMCSLAANVLEQGSNVLYITMEMQEEKIAQRIDQNLLNIGHQEIEDISLTVFKKKFDNLRNKTKGELIIKEYPTGNASSVHFKALLKELELKKDFKPDLLCIDYLNICNSARVGKDFNTYERVKYIAEELRGLAVEFNVPIVSATQTNRSGLNTTAVDLTNTSESIALPQTADYMFSMISTEEMRNNGMIKISQLKNRYGDLSDRGHWIMGVDYDKMRLLDIDTQPANIDAINEAAKTNTTDTRTLFDTTTFGEREEPTKVAW